MSLERIQTAVLTLAMLIFYFLIMPNEVDQIEDARIVPTTVPSIAIWTIIIAGAFQFFSDKVSLELKPQLCLRAIVCTVFIIASVATMERFGFEFGAPILALGVMLGIGERRLHWILLGTLLIPISVWLLVEHVLGRTLP